MKVLRIEHKETGRGPYDCSFDGVPKKDGIPIYADHDDDAHPDGFRGDINSKSFNYNFESIRFGFSSEEQCFNWFQGWFKVFTEYNYVLVEYEVPEEVVVFSNSKKQIVFQAAFAKKIKEINTTEFEQKFYYQQLAKVV